jgi:polysaccharide export outer membrane protein
MKVLKSVLALAAACTFAASSPRAQEQKQPKHDDQKSHQSKSEKAQSEKGQPEQARPEQATPEQPATAASQPAPLRIDESKLYTGHLPYLLGPSDVVELRVFNDPQFNGEFEVDTDGNISVPFVDQPIRAQCRTVNDLSKDVRSAVGKFIREPRIYMRVKDQKSHKPVIIYGAVHRPDAWDMRRPVRLLELVSNSGGVSEQQSGTIQIMHTEPPQCPDIEPTDMAPVQSASDPLGLPFTIYKVADLKQGRPEANPYLRPGDIVYVAEAPPVYVVGNVGQPTSLFLREGTTLTRVMAQVGGPKDANEEKLRIYRRKESGEQQIVEVNFKAVKQGKEPDPLLQPYDIVEVPKRGVWSPEGISKMLQGVATQTVSYAGTGIVPRILY